MGESDQGRRRCDGEVMYLREHNCVSSPLWARLSHMEFSNESSLRTQGRLAERLYEATTASTYGSIQSYAIALPLWGRVRERGKLQAPDSRHPLSISPPQGGERADRA